MQYLDSYSSRGLRSERVFKAVLAVVAVGAMLAGIHYFFFRNWQEERVARQFFELLQAGAFEQAYSMWGCSVEEPCRYYPFDEFLEDWGPEAPYGSLEAFALGRSYTQPGGVILRYSINGRPGDPLWVERDPPTINFAPN